MAEKALKINQRYHQRQAEKKGVYYHTTTLWKNKVTQELRDTRIYNPIQLDATEKRLVPKGAQKKT